MQLWMMKMMHHWFGVAFAAFFFVICMSGVAVTLSDQIVPTVVKSDFRAKLVSVSPQSAGQAADVIATSTDGSPAQLDYPVRGRAVYKLTLTDGRAFYYDQTDYSLIGNAQRRGLSKLLWNVHANLLNVFGMGRSIVVWTGLVGVYLAALGFLIFIPQWRGFRRKEILHPKSLTFRDMRRAHMSSGVVFGIFVAFFGFTGWAVGEPDARGLLSGSAAQISLPELSQPGAAIGDIVTRTMSKAVSDNTVSVRPARIVFGQGDGPSETVIHLSLKGDLSLQGHYRAGFDAQSGLLTSWQDGRTATRGARFYGAMEAIHTGEGLPLLYKLILCVLGFITGLIALTGLLSYALKWKMKFSRIRQKRKNAMQLKPKE